MDKSQPLLEDLLLRYLIFVLRLLMEIHMTLHRRTHKHNIASVDQCGSRPTFGCDELVCIVVDSLNTSTCAITAMTLH